MAFNTLGPRDALVALVAALPGMQGTPYKGVPESFATTVGAYVAIGGRQMIRNTAGGMRRRLASYYVGFGYRVRLAESDADDKLGAMADAFDLAFEGDPTLGGTCETAMFEVIEDDPRYQPMAAQEYRHYRIRVTCEQYEVIPL